MEEISRLKEEEQEAPAMLKTDNPLFTSVLDSMSDGQWHSMSKVIKNNSTHLSHLSEEDRSITLVDFFTDLAQEGHILLGNNDSQRFTLDSLIEWREFRGIPQENNISSPRFFGGVLEDDGWDSSPLRLYDVIHFRATGEVTQERIQELIGVKGHVTKDVDGLYRIMTIYGNDIYLDLKQWSIDNGDRCSSEPDLTKAHTDERLMNCLPNTSMTFVNSMGSSPTLCFARTSPASRDTYRMRMTDNSRFTCGS